MKSKLDNYKYKVIGKDVVLVFRYPTVKEYKFIQGQFKIEASDENDFTDQWARGINLILVTWEGADIPFNGDVQDVVDVADLMFLQRELLSGLTLDAINKKKSLLQLDAFIQTAKEGS